MDAEKTMAARGKVTLPATEREQASIALDGAEQDLADAHWGVTQARAALATAEEALKEAQLRQWKAWDQFQLHSNGQPRMKALTRDAVIALLHEPLRVRDIAERLSVSKAVVSRHKRRHEARDNCRQCKARMRVPIKKLV